MANRRCPKCGEEYSDTYRSCPFCEEEDALKHGKTLHRRGGRRVEKRPGRTGGAGGVFAGLIYRFFDRTIFLSRILLAHMESSGSYKAVQRVTNSYRRYFSVFFLFRQPLYFAAKREV